MPTEIDPDDFPRTDAEAELNGRFANPPFIFGAGGVELLALEMTEDLQALKQAALANPGVVFELTTKGVSFGSIVADAGGGLDLTDVEGVGDDLVVRPFGRKGEFATVRDFDIGAMRFHFGMEPVESVGQDVDGDGDGVFNEITVGDLSALSIFVVTADRPVMQRLSASAARGLDDFQAIGCASCHIPSLRTERAELPMRFPEVPELPFDNEYYSVDLTRAPASFDSTATGGLVVPLFGDLKRHDMGADLAESFALVDDATNREYTTARLWGIADTAPYLHDGRATTLTDAILMHGGEAQAVRDAFASLDEAGQDDLIAFLRSLRAPENPLKQLLHRAKQGDGTGGGTREEAVEFLRSVRPTQPVTSDRVGRVRQEDL
jgi:hypothetical protein